MTRPAFSLPEVLIIIGILGVVSSVTIPLFNEYLIRSDLDTAVQYVQQGMARAKFLSEAGSHDSAWGFFVPAGTLYKGESYATRDPAYDELFPMSPSIAVSGLL